MSPTSVDSLETWTTATAETHRTSDEHGRAMTAIARFGAISLDSRDPRHVADHQPPDWPGNQVPKQMHLDLFVTDLDSAERAAITVGAVKPAFQPSPDRWRVLLDPSGHPFCLTVMSGGGE
ncbi:VOC family protein [Nocardia sp. NBC_01327]|uniref:VOC family protein n=1 Tax=Nocardia sp. NBC_01327 TaxID=2903593 RepID=UPI002E11FC7B